MQLSPLVLCCVLSTSTNLTAQESRPAEALPSAAAADPDLTSARSAALAWIQAVGRGDITAAYKMLRDDPADRALAADLLCLNAAIRNLESASLSKFGDAGKRVTGYPDGPKATADQLRVREDGDSATADVPGSMLPLRLRRTDGRWMVDLSEAAQDPRVRNAARGSRRAADVANRMAEEVAAGRFESADAAREEFRKRRLATAPASRRA